MHIAALAVFRALDNDGNSKEKRIPIIATPTNSSMSENIFFIG